MTDPTPADAHSTIRVIARTLLAAAPGQTMTVQDLHDALAAAAAQILEQPVDAFARLLASDSEMSLDRQRRLADSPVTLGNSGNTD